MRLSHLARLWRTTSSLHPSQIAWRIWYFIVRRLEERCSPAPRLLRNVAPLPSALRAVSLERLPRSSWGTGSSHYDRQRHTLRLLHRERAFRGGADWCAAPGQRVHRLEINHLQSHGWLRACLSDATLREAAATCIADWIQSCPLGKRGFAQLAWNSYVIASRLMSWAALAPHLPWPDNDAHRRFVESFGVQAAYLNAHVEHDLRGNHLIRDAAGLAVAGAAWSGAAAARWSRQGLALAHAEAARQVLADGGHYERSVMYHVHAMCDLLTIHRLADGASRLEPVLARMAEFLRWMRHPDGEVTQFHDAALGVEADPASVLALLGVPLEHPRGARLFRDSGYVAWHDNDWSIFFDVGGVGPREQPGHAHASNLSIECSFRRRRLFVDTGTYAYDADETRRRDRSTDAHNTVCVDGLDSSELWHIFRVGRRARSTLILHDASMARWRATARHDGYRELVGRPRVERAIELAAGRFTIEDRVYVTSPHALSATWLLAPEWRLTPDVDGWFCTDGERRLRVEVRGALAEIVRLPWHPTYGVRIESQALRWATEASGPTNVILSVMPL